MTKPAIISIGTAVPPQRLSQMEIFEQFLEPHYGRNRLARAIFNHAGVSFRHAAIDGSFYDRQRTTKERNDQYVEAAIPLAEDAVRCALTLAGMQPEEIDDLYVVSCTGYEIPGLDLHVAGRLNMRPDLRRTCVLGMGCYGAFPALGRAMETVTAGPNRVAVVLALELCSLHLQFDDTLENIVASALFADGAAAAIIGGAQRLASSPGAGEPRDTRYPHMLDAATFSNYRTFDHMSFHVTDTGFHMRLSPAVPDVLADNVLNLVTRLLSPHRLTPRDVRFWGVHPGSQKILDRVQESLALDPSQLEFSRTVLRNYGNMSSVTVLFVLDEIVRQGMPRPGDYGVLLGFGPGLTLESALVQW